MRLTSASCCPFRSQHNQGGNPLKKRPRGDCACNFAFVELHQKAGKLATAAFLRNLNAAGPVRLNIVLTDTDIQLTKGIFMATKTP